MHTLRHILADYVGSQTELGKDFISQGAKEKNKLKKLFILVFMPV